MRLCRLLYKCLKLRKNYFLVADGDGGLAKRRRTLIVRRVRVVGRKHWCLYLLPVQIIVRKNINIRISINAIIIGIVIGIALIAMTERFF